MGRKQREKRLRRAAKAAEAKAAERQSSPRPTPAPQRRALWATALVLVLATLGAYWRVHDQGFIEFDDQKYVEENAMVQKGLTGEGFAWAFTTQHASNYHPSNARINFYGDDDPVERLRLLDDRLSAFTKATVDSDVALQPRFSAPVRHDGTYAAGEGPEA